MSDLVVKRHAIPDWHSCKSIVMVYPYKMRDREHLMPFYDKLLAFIPDEVGITLVAKDLSFSQEYQKTCRANGITNSIDFIEIPCISDIWIRDYAPLVVAEQGLITATQFEYEPAYVDKKYTKYLQADHKAGELLWKHLYGYGVNSMYFNWDLGNLTHNGLGTAVVTNRLIASNQEVDIQHELKPMLHVIAGFKNLVFIPTEPLDSTGHIDGMARFISEKTLVVGAYAAGFAGHNLMNSIADNLQDDLGTDFQVIRLMNGCPEDFESEGIASAVGNHMNFLRLNDTILFPYYGDEISKRPLHDFILALRHYNLNINVIPVDMPEIKDLVRLGGVLNCISWQVF